LVYSSTDGRDPHPMLTQPYIAPGPSRLKTTVLVGFAVDDKYYMYCIFMCTYVYCFLRIHYRYRYIFHIYIYIVYIYTVNKIPPTTSEVEVNP
jgi:hypothetical protein